MIDYAKRPPLHAVTDSNTNGVWRVYHPDFGEVGFFTNPFIAARFCYAVDSWRKVYESEADALMAARGYKL